MAIKSAEEIQGYEYDWLACDKSGRVAVFSTAGSGLAPTAFLADTDAHQKAIRELLLLPPTTTATLAPELKEGLPNTWKELAVRGLYAFDADPNKGPYVLVAKPKDPTYIYSLPQSVVEVVEKIMFAEFQIAGAFKIAYDEIRRNTCAEAWYEPQ